MMWLGWLQFWRKPRAFNGLATCASGRQETRFSRFAFGKVT